jgi:hypothetical protein
MHAQIKQVIDTLLFTPGKVAVRLSAGEQTPLGKIIGRLYYQSKVMDLLTHDERFGYPHNGGQHTLELHCKPLDAVSMIEAMKEEAEDRKFATNADEWQVVAELSYISQEILAGRKKV